MSTYKLNELADETGVPPRTIRYYVQRKLLPPPDFHGPHSTYGPLHALRLHAIRALQMEGVALYDIEMFLAGADAEQLEKLVRGGASPVVRRPAPSLPPPDRPDRLAPPPHAARAPNATPQSVESTRQTWERLELLPGVELHVKTSASPFAQRIAHEIRTLYGPHSHAEDEE